MLQVRLDYISEVNDYIRQSKTQFNDILKDLGWKKKDVNISDVQDNEVLLCPHNENHRITKKNFNDHLLKCSLRKEGYNLEDVFLPPAPDTFRNVLVIDKQLQENILQNVSTDIATGSAVGIERNSRPVPQTSERLFTDFTPAERLTLYNFSIQNTSYDSEVTDADLNLPFTKTQEESRPKTSQELLTAERDAKRRRIKYKSKKVHTNRKTQTEIMREVIESQMEGYEEWLQQNGLHLSMNPIKEEIVVPEIKQGDSEHVGKITVRKITKDWDDWLYCKGNPHNRYISVLDEERNKSKKKVFRYEYERDSKRSRDGSGNQKDKYSSHKRDDRSSRITDSDYSRRNKEHGKFGKSDYRYDKYRKCERYMSEKSKQDNSFKRRHDGNRSYENLYTRYYAHEESSSHLRSERSTSKYSSSKKRYRDRSDDEDNYKQRKSKKHKHEKKHKKKNSKSSRYSKKSDSNEDSDSDTSSAKSYASHSS